MVGMYEKQIAERCRLVNKWGAQVSHRCKARNVTSILVGELSPSEAWKKTILPTARSRSPLQGRILTGTCNIMLYAHRPASQIPTMCLIINTSPLEFSARPTEKGLATMLRTSLHATFDIIFSTYLTLESVTLATHGSSRRRSASFIYDVTDVEDIRCRVVIVVTASRFFLKNYHFVLEIKLLVSYP